MKNYLKFKICIQISMKIYDISLESKLRFFENAFPYLLHITYEQVFFSSENLFQFERMLISFNGQYHRLQIVLGNSIWYVNDKPYELSDFERHLPSRSL